MILAGRLKWLVDCSELGEMLTGPGGLLDRGKEPKWYREAPAMADWQQCQFYLNAFLELNTCREYGAMGGIYSIPWHHVMYYADRLGLNRESARHFWAMIRDIDHHYVKDHNRRHAPKKKPPPAQPTRGRLRRRTREKTPEPDPGQ